MKPNYKKNWLKGPIKPMEPIYLNNDRIINDEIGNILIKKYIETIVKIRQWRRGDIFLGTSYILVRQL